MKIDLHRFYQYIFGEMSHLEKHLPAQLTSKQKEKAIKNREEEIIQFFSELIPLQLHPVFQAALYEIPSAKPLLKLLYKESETYNFYAFPDDKEIEEHFKTLENKYHYFNKAKDPENFLEKFKIFFKVAKLIGDCVERNNDGHDKEAAVRAYKMLVVFGYDDEYPLRPITRYLEKHFEESTHPLHDALIYPIPVNSDFYQVDLKKWRALIQENGPDAFQLFDIAPDIERELKKTPESLEEFKEAIKTRFLYKNAKSSPELANICIDNFVSEDDFDHCREIEKLRKKSDYLPNVIIDGSELKRPGYYLVKLPVDDPRAYILGHLTNSCQSIGGESEQCVIDGVTLKNNGFYVLLKAKEIGPKLKPKKSKTSDKKIDDLKLSAAPFKDDKINYGDFEIIGQGYAWLSKQGNLTFDSWENLKPGRDNRIIVPMLEKFSQVVTHNADFNITRVTIGQGGKTPEKWAQNEETVPCREFMREGSQYEDSISQAEIYCNQDKRKLFIAPLEALFNKIIPPDEKIKPIRDKLHHWVVDSCCCKEYAERSLAILNEKSVQDFIIAELKAPDLAESNRVPWDIMMVLFEKKFDLSKDLWRLLKESFDLNEKIPASADDILNALTLLDPSLVNGMHHSLQFILIESMMNHPENAINHVNHLNSMIKNLHDAKLENDSDLFQLILKKPDHLTQNIINAFAKLNRVGLKIDSQVRECLFGNPYYAEDVGTAFFMLKSMQMPIEHDQIKYSILKTPNRAIEIAKKIITTSAPYDAGLFSPSETDKNLLHTERKEVKRLAAGKKRS